MMSYPYNQTHNLLNVQAFPFNEVASSFYQHALYNDVYFYKVNPTPAATKTLYEKFKKAVYAEYKSAKASTAHIVFE